MRRLLCLPVLLLVLNACASPLTIDQARATAVAGGCWPYGVHQPNTPTPPATARPGTPQPTPPPMVVDYPACTPQPGTPTATIRPTPTPRPPVPTPPPLAVQGGRTELGQQPGAATPWARATRSPALAICPSDGRAAVAWLAWGGGPDADAGDVWVRVQDRNGRWRNGQTLNRAPIRSFGGGLGIAWTISETIAVAFASADAHIQFVSTRDAGASWGVSEDSGLRGRVVSLRSDASGTLYLLALVDGLGLRSDPPDGQYGYPVLARRPMAGHWSISTQITRELQYSGDLALVEPAGQATRLYAILTDWDRANGSFPSTVTLAASADGGQSWMTRRLNDRAQVASAGIVATSFVAAQRPDGSVVVAAAWSQTPGPGPAAGAVQARLSRDGGQTWGDVETIAQHQHDGRFTEDPSNPAYVGGFEPSLVYDMATDRIAASWIADDLSRRDARDASSTNRSVRTLLAARSLDDATSWQFAVTPDGLGDISPQLTAWGQRGALWGAAGGRWHWLTIIDERNVQSRILAQPVTLSALLAQGVP